MESEKKNYVMLWHDMAYVEIYVNQDLKKEL